MFLVNNQSFMFLRTFTFAFALLGKEKDKTHKAEKEEHVFYITKRDFEEAPRSSLESGSGDE